MFSDLIAKTSVIKYKVITEEAFTKITSLFNDLKTEMKSEFTSFVVECLYEIKIGDQIYSGPSFEEFEKQYKKNYRADNIRLVIQASDYQQQLNPVKASISLVLDRIQESRFHIMGGRTNWVNGVFSRFNEIMRNIPSRNVMLHSVIFEMSVQLLAVIIMTIFSIFAANRLASLVQIQFSEVYIFVIIFLLLSNLWTYIGRGLIAIRDEFYPVVDIIRTPRKPIFLTIILFILAAAGSWAVKYVLDLLFEQP